MNKYVITYTQYKLNFEVIWTGVDSTDALTTFWNSYDETDRAGVSDVKIYNVVEINRDTSPPVYKEALSDWQKDSLITYLNETDVVREP